jgi:hypothetical protein
MPDSRDDEQLAPNWPADDPRWRMVQEDASGMTVNGRPVREFRPEDFPTSGRDDELPEL